MLIYTVFLPRSQSEPCSTSSFLAIRTRCQTGVTPMADHRFSTKLLMKRENKIKTQKPSKTKLQNKNNNNNNTKVKKRSGGGGRKSTTAFTEKKDIIFSFCFFSFFVQMLFVKSIAAACEATRRPVRRRGCSTTARAAGAAVRPGPPAAGRQPSLSGWRWTSRGRRSEGPRGAETQERHNVIGRLVRRGRRSKTFGKFCASDLPSLIGVSGSLWFCYSNCFVSPAGWKQQQLQLPTTKFIL